MTTEFARHLAFTLSQNAALAMEATFHLGTAEEPDDYTVGASWYRLERDEDVGEDQHIVEAQRLRVPMSELPRMPEHGDRVTVAGRKRQAVLLRGKKGVDLTTGGAV